MGKIHPLCFRIGKVRASTPKVAREERNKRLTGRASKRRLYNRRVSPPQRQPTKRAG